jgi:hypothetical protein
VLSRPSADSFAVGRRQKSPGTRARSAASVMSGCEKDAGQTETDSEEEERAQLLLAHLLLATIMLPCISVVFSYSSVLFSYSLS